MHCLFCGAEETKVIDSRLVDEGAQVRRRRECLQCGERFNTFETAEIAYPRIKKRDGTGTTFDSEKIRSGILKALEKRPVNLEQVDQAVNHVLHQVRASGEREISSQVIGEFVMDELRELDKVAYVRFASIYRSFKDVNEFRDEIQRLQGEISES